MEKYKTKIIICCLSLLFVIASIAIYLIRRHCKKELVKGKFIVIVATYKSTDTLEEQRIGCFQNIDSVVL